MAKIREPDVYIGSIFTSEDQCGWPECDSWKTVKMQLVGYSEKEENIRPVWYSLCSAHLFEFIDQYVLKGAKNKIWRSSTGEIEE